MRNIPRVSPVDFSEFEQKSIAHQSLLADLGVRTKQGSFYTPLDVAGNLAITALNTALARVQKPSDCPRVLDPTCGTGNFLIASALHISERLVQLGMSQTESFMYVVKNCLFGTDIDLSAVEICRSNLARLIPESNCESELSRHVLAVDSLRLFLKGGGRAGQGSLFDEPEMTWADIFAEVFAGDDPGFDAVIGNPPFLNQLETETALSADLASALSERYGNSFSKLTNTASIFMLGASEIVNSGGVVTMIQPISFLATRESAEIRKSLLNRGSLTDLWFGGSKIFDAAVEVVGVTISAEQPDGKTRITVGREFNEIGFFDAPQEGEKTWSRPLARAKGVPHCAFSAGGVVGDYARATADFRDQYYGLVGAVRDLQVSESQGDLLRLATVGLIDLAKCMWGERSTKFARQTYLRPVVDVQVLSKELRNWAISRAKPKVIVSNQTKLLEVYVDVGGDILPSVPLLTLDCEIENLWLVAAAISSPLATLVAAERHLGAGMSGDVLKLSAKDVLNLPVPSDVKAWTRGAQIFKELQEKGGSDGTKLLQSFADEMNTAFAVSDLDIGRWWIGRLPRR